MILFSARSFLQCNSEKDAGWATDSPASVSPPASSLLSWPAVSQASSCLLLCEVIEMQHQTRAHTHSDWHLGHILSGDWEAWHPADRAAILNLLSPLGIKDMSEPHHPRAPFYSLVLFCLNHPQLLHHQFPGKEQGNKAAKRRRAWGEGKGGGRRIPPCQSSLCDSMYEVAPS